MNCKETDIMPKAFFANKSERFKANKWFKLDRFFVNTETNCHSKPILHDLVSFYLVSKCPGR